MSSQTASKGEQMHSHFGFNSSYHRFRKTLFVTYQAASLGQNEGHVEYISVEDRSHIFPLQLDP